MVCDCGVRCGLDIDAGPRRDVVNDNRLAAGVGDVGIILDEPFLCRLVVVRGDDKAGVGAGFAGEAGQVDRVVGMI